MRAPGAPDPRRLLRTLLLTALALATPLPSTGQEAHFPLAADLRTLTVLGDLDRARVLADALLDPGDLEALPAGYAAETEALANAVQRVRAAGDLDALTFAVAETGVSCGVCHLAAQVSPPDGSATVPAPRGTDEATRHTEYLGWSSRLLWAGVVLPSERAWRVGAGALVGEGSYPVPRAGHVPAEVNVQAATELDRLAAQAILAEEGRARADLLARIWWSCADCHVPAGVGR